MTRGYCPAAVPSGTSTVQVVAKDASVRRRAAVVADVAVTAHPCGPLTSTETLLISACPRLVTVASRVAGVGCPGMRVPTEPLIVTDGARLAAGPRSGCTR